MTDIPDQEEEFQTQFLRIYCDGGEIYLEGGDDNVIRYNPFINEWGFWVKRARAALESSSKRGSFDRIIRWCTEILASALVL